MKSTVKLIALLTIAQLAMTSALAKPISKNISSPPLIAASYEQVQSDLAKHLGVNVRWGGQVIGSQSIDQITRITVLAYPLEANGTPSTERAIQGNAFAIDFDNSSLPRKLKEGNFITVYGPVIGGLKLTNGPLETLVPVIASEEVKKWNQRNIVGLNRTRNRDRFASERLRYYNSLGFGSLGFVGNRRGFSTFDNRFGTFGASRFSFGSSRFKYGSSRFGFGSSRFGHGGHRGFSKFRRYGRY